MMDGCRHYWVSFARTFNYFVFSCAFHPHGLWDLKKKKEKVDDWRVDRWTAAELPKQG
jgi:hypothetical protein